MKVLDIEEFLKLPEGVVFSYFRPDNAVGMGMEGLFIKGETYDHALVPEDEVEPGAYRHYGKEFTQEGLIPEESGDLQGETSEQWNIALAGYPEALARLPQAPRWGETASVFEERLLYAVYSREEVLYLRGLLDAAISATPSTLKIEDEDDD